MSGQLSSAHVDWAAQFCGMPGLAAPGGDQPNGQGNQTDTTPPPAENADAPDTGAGPSTQSSGPDTAAPAPPADTANGQQSQASDPNAAPPPPDDNLAT